LKIRKAIFPAAGLGTRFLPATKASPKEMLPLVDKPLIQYGVEEAVASGIKDIIIITGRGKTAIEDHFDVSFELEHVLKERGKVKLLKRIQRISNMVNFTYIRQKQALGLGHAILCAKDLIGDEPFAVFLGDDIVDSKVPVMQNMIQAYKKYKCSIVAIEKVAKEDVSSYGIIKHNGMEGPMCKIEDLVEKPDVDKAPSNLAIIGRYLLTPEIFGLLEKTKPGKNNEIQLTDALRALLKEQDIYGYQFDGVRYDAGDKLGYLKANLMFALKDPELAEPMKRFVKKLKL
jgi:UTP--glucose-1-phosphate uridylyltransferase